VIVGVDRSDERLTLAKELGATHTINTSDPQVNLVEVVKSYTDGVGASIVIDTTGNMGVIGSGMDFTANRGQMVILGVPPIDGSLGVHLITFMQTGKQLRGSIEGDVTPSEVCEDRLLHLTKSNLQQYIPKMIKWYRDGKLPIEKLVKFYKVSSNTNTSKTMRNDQSMLNFLPRLRIMSQP
jgi:Zn-dependent alcohol dehydrogenase